MKTVDIRNLTRSQALKLVEFGELVLYKNKLYIKEDYELIKDYQAKSEYYDMLQGVRKVLLNSAYGSTLSEFCRFHDPRLGASTTGSGRQITTHMIETVAINLMGENAPKLIKTVHQVDSKTQKSGTGGGNSAMLAEGISNEYTLDVPPGIGPIYGDTDSVASDSIVGVCGIDMKVENAFSTFAYAYRVEITNGREMVWVNPVEVTAKSLSGYSKLKGIYRHKTSKRRFKVILESGKQVIVTEDHSVMIERDGKLIKIKPLEMNKDTDVCISITRSGLFGFSFERISSIQELDPFNDEYVYDLIMENSDEPYFFANGILVHNSCYFTMENLVGDNVDDAIQCADAIAEAVNDSFPEFMRNAFFCQPGFDELIKANRETVATAGIFRAKKKYILLVADVEGTRLDPNNPKALKSQGSDIKISSTPETIRKLLKTVTLMLLTNVPAQAVNDFIIDFRRNLNNNPDVRPLDFATITSVKNLDEYFEKWVRIEKPGFGRTKLPNNVRSSINHNLCLEMFEDHDTLPIRSGAKIKIVWLIENEHGFESMAFDSDTEVLPKWFTDNFEIDVKTTEKKLVDQKLKNIFEPIGREVPTEQTIIVNNLLTFD